MKACAGAEGARQPRAHYPVTHSEAPNWRILMRTVRLSVLLLLIVNSPITAQEPTPSRPVLWSVGLARGLGPSTTGGSTYRSAEGSTSLLAQWKRGTSRLGFRAELTRGYNDYAAPGRFTDGCIGCAPFSSDQTSHAVIVSGVAEFRQGHVVRPYAILGLGVAETTTDVMSYIPCTMPACGVLRKEVVSSFRSVGSVIAPGIGLSVNLKRVTVFGESRPLLTGRGGLAAVSSGLTLGIRIQPEN